jgi:eukaryotic-like serine/threonine-protein kinase
VETTTRAYAEGRYEVRTLLGRGGMATVYLAHDRELDRPVALKVLHRSGAADDEFAHRFRREAQTAARLAHPNVVQIFDTGEEDGDQFIVMEYVEGEGLDAVLAREGRLDPARALGLGEQACAGLAYAHDQGVVHRDVKPANLLLRADGVLKVTDFGIAQAADATALTQAGTLLGTASYVAPEQARGAKVGPAADVFSLGVVLYELLTGKLPWRIESLADLPNVGAKPARPIRELAPEVSPAVEGAVMRSLETDPRRRPADCGELLSELRTGDEALLGPQRTEATRPLRETAATELMRRRRPTRRRVRGGRWVRALAVFLVAVILGIVVGVALLDDGDDGSPPEPARVEPVPSSEDPVEQARNLAEWLRDHTG